MNSDDIYLQPKQRAVLSLMQARGEDVPTKIGFGGSRGGAKSGGARRIALTLTAAEPFVKTWIIRRVSEDLRKDHITPFFDDFPFTQDWYRAVDKEIVMPNRSRISFVYLETLADVIRKCRGPQAKYIIVDQAEQFAEEELKRMEASNRAAGSKPGECKLLACFNPGGPGTEYLRRVFYLRKYEEGEADHDYAFIQSYGWDNYEWFRGAGVCDEKEFYSLPNDVRFSLFITKTDYGKKLNSLPADLRIGELMGSFDTFAGQYFAGVWIPDKTVLRAEDAASLISPWWSRWMSIEWGRAKVSAAHWFAAGTLSVQQLSRLGITSEIPLRVVIAYREKVIEGKTPAQLARCLVDETPKAERQYFSKIVLSPGAFGDDDSARTIADTMGSILRAGELPRPVSADDERVGGWNLLYEGFSESATRHASGAMSQPHPMLLISSACPMTIGAVPLLTRDPDNPEDVLETAMKADGICNSLRYGFKGYTASSNTPRPIVRQELYDSIGDPTARVLAMRQFDQRRSVRIGHRSYR